MKHYDYDEFCKYVQKRNDYRTLDAIAKGIISILMLFLTGGRKR